MRNFKREPTGRGDVVFWNPPHREYPFQEKLSYLVRLMSQLAPCRLYVLFARDADIGVILRRGPTRWVQVIRWDTRYDTFEDGAWFHGRIYEDYCDVSPDGELFVYFAAKHNRGLSADEYGYALTAVSRAPWLSALALWPSPVGTWPGGGRFRGERHLTLLPPGEIAGEATSHSKHPPPRGLAVDVGCWRDFARAKPMIEVEGAQWSGRDQKNRIVFARDGKLFRRINGQDCEVMDFNGRVPEPRRAPSWAEHLERRRPVV